MMAPAQALAAVSVLVIEDDAGLRLAEGEFMMRAGYRVSLAVDGEEGIRLAQSQPFELAVCDLSLPGMDGLAVLDALKRLQPKCELLMVTGYASMQSALECMRHGAYDYISKPFDKAQLLRLMEKALERRSLNLKVVELEELNRLKSDFVASMSHELRTPMNAVMGFTELLLEGAYGALNAEQAGALRSIGDGGAELLALIDSVLELGRLSAGSLEAHNAPFDAAKLCREAAAEAGPKAAAKGIQLSCSAEGEAPLASDRAKLKRIVTCLLDNAVKFTVQGSVSLSLHQAAGVTRISVTDTGLGMGPDKIPFLFQEFRQLDSALNRQFGGMGLGLAIAKKMAALLGGNVEVESELGKGSRFTVAI